MARCIICGEENNDTSYVLMIRRDGSEAEMCPACSALISSLEDAEKKTKAVAALKGYASHCGDYEVRRFLEGVISSADDPESYNEYIEETRHRRDKVKDTSARRDIHRLVRPSAFVLLLFMTLGGIFRAVMSFSGGAVIAGIIELVITAVTVGAAVIILAAVMDALDEVRAMSRRRR